MRTRTKSIIVFLTDLSLSPILAQIGAVIVDICCLWVQGVARSVMVGPCILFISPMIAGFQLLTLITFCVECGISCHSKCAHLVPDFCGMSMEMANQMLAEIKAAKRRTNEVGTPKPQKAERPTSGGSTTSLGERMDSLPSGISQLSLQGGPQQQSHNHGQYPQQYSPSSMHMPPPMPPQGQHQMQYPQARPQPPPQAGPGNYNMSQPGPQSMQQGYGYPNMPPPHMRQPMNPPHMQQPMNTPPMQRVPSPARPQSYAPVPNTAMMPRPYPGSPSPYQPGPSPQMGQHMQQRPHPAAPRVSSNGNNCIRCPEVAYR